MLILPAMGESDRKGMFDDSNLEMTTGHGLLGVIYLFFGRVPIPLRPTWASLPIDGSVDSMVSVPSPRSPVINVKRSAPL